MSRLIINGGTRLEGTVTISGSKNAALGVIPAAILSKGISVIENVPEIEDVERMLDIIRRLGVKCALKDNTLTIDSTEIRSTSANCPECNCLRASSYLLGALIGRAHKITLGLTGGCDIGERPLNYHIDAFNAMGIDSISSIDGITLTGSPRGADITLPFPSVGATINIMLAASLAEGNTIINNAATEPHIADVAKFINLMGGMIVGAGTGEIKIKGRKKLKSTNFRIMPDQIEAGTYMIYGAVTGGDVTVKNINVRDMKILSDILINMGAEITEGRDSLRICVPERLKAADISTAPYPEFPTDLQPLMTTLLSVSDGQSTVRENIFNNRLKHVRYLAEMGAEITTEENIARITGVERLSCRNVCALDLRGGAALVGAGLSAEGCTVVENAHIILRGYENMDKKINALGGHAEYVENIEKEEIFIPSAGIKTDFYSHA